MSVMSFGNPSVSRDECSIPLYWKVTDFASGRVTAYRRNSDKLRIFLSVRYLDPIHVHVRMPSVACKRLKCNRSGQGLKSVWLSVDRL